jgi:hypothetical protein
MLFEYSNSATVRNLFLSLEGDSGIKGSSYQAGTRVERNVGNKRNPAAVSNWASHTQTTVQGKEKVLETFKNDLLSRFHNIFLTFGAGYNPLNELQQSAQCPLHQFLQIVTVCHLLDPKLGDVFLPGLHIC